MYNGQKTLAGQQVEQQLSDAKFDRAMTLISAGLTDAQIAADLGLTLAQAQQLRSNLVAARTPTGSSGGGSSGGGGTGTGATPGSVDISSQAGLNALYRAISSSGMDTDRWLRANGAKYGIKTTEASIDSYVEGYDAWYDLMHPAPSTKTPKAPATSNPAFVNNNSADNWINIGGIRYGISEIEKMIDAGKVGARKLDSGKLEYYFK
jgi:hypothetical protein